MVMMVSKALDATRRLGGSRIAAPRSGTNKANLNSDARTKSQRLEVS
jgi:hypothetical protein